MRKLLISAAAAALTIASAANAQSFNFDSPTGHLGSSQSYTSGLYTVVATGYSAPNTTTDLYGKNGGAGEMGLGLNGYADNEIPSVPVTAFIQLDVSSLINAVTGMNFTMNSTTLGEGWAVYGSNTAGDGGTLLFSGNDESSHALTDWGQYNFYDFYSTGTHNGETTAFGDVLLSSLVSPVPEPATWALMLLGFGGIGLTMRRRRKPALAQLA